MVKISSTAPDRGKTSPAEALTAQAWAEADHALAEALVAQYRLEAALGGLLRKAARRKDEALREAAATVDGEALALSQGLLRAAKVRGLSLFGEAGAAAKFDAKRHIAVKGAPKKGAAVQLLSPGVKVGKAVLLLAEVRPARSKPKAAAKKTAGRKAAPRTPRA